MLVPGEDGVGREGCPGMNGTEELELVAEEDTISDTAGREDAVRSKRKVTFGALKKREEEELASAMSERGGAKRRVGGVSVPYRTSSDGERRRAK